MINTKAITSLVCLFLLALVYNSGAALQTRENPLMITQKAGASQAQAVFHLSNPGEKPLDIVYVEKTCGCQQTKLGKKHLKPGEETTLEVTVNTGRARGTLRKIVRVHHQEEGGAKQIMSLTINIEIPQVYSITPQSITWFREQEMKPQTFVMEVHQEQKVHIRELIPSTDEVKAELKVIEEGRKYEITLTPQKTIQLNYGTLDILTDCPISHLTKPRVYYIVRNPPVKQLTNTNQEARTQAERPQTPDPDKSP